MSFSLFYRFLFLLFFCPFLSWGQVTFVAQAPSTGTGELRVQFVLSNAEGEDFTPPSFADFTVLAGPSVSNYSSTSIVNGRMSNVSSVTYTYILAPKHKGVLNIGPASVRVGGKTLHTKKLSVKVNDIASGTAAAVSNSSAAQPYEQLQREGSKVTERDLYFTVQTSKKRVYEQEPIMLTYEIHARAGVGLANVSLTQKPELKGFWTQEIQLPRNLQPRTERRGDKLYRVATNLQYLVFPQHAGTLTIPSVRFDCDIAQRREYVDEIEAFFNGMEENHVKVSRSTPQQELQVLPLPMPRAAGFSGGVGQMQVKRTLLTGQAKTNDVATLRVSIVGNGNLRLIKAPRVKFPESFDSYAPKMVDETTISSQGITGAVHFDYTFVPRKVGRFVLPAIELVYFDTKSETYQTVRTSTLSLQVEKGLRSDAELNNELALRQADLRDIQRDTDGNMPTQEMLWPKTLSFYLLLLVALAMAWGASQSVVRVVRHWQGGEQRGEQQAHRRAQRVLAQTKSLMKTGGQAYYEALSEGVMQYLAGTLGREKSALTRQIIREELLARELPEQNLKALEALLDELDFVRFAPLADETMREALWERARQLLQTLHTQLR